MLSYRFNFFLVLLTTGYYLSKASILSREDVSRILIEGRSDGSLANVTADEGGEIYLLMDPSSPTDNPTCVISIAQGGTIQPVPGEGEKTTDATDR